MASYGYAIHMNVVATISKGAMTLKNNELLRNTDFVIVHHFNG